MLLIGDIHINSKIQDHLLSKLREVVSKQPEEKNLIFLGDFVYHFSYDRKALLALFDRFLELYKQGKTLYILAGNHDRLGQHFVFEEARKLLLSFGMEGSEAKRNEESLINHKPLDKDSSLRSEGQKEGLQLKFITTPQIHQIEDNTYLFLPFMLGMNSQKLNETIENHVSSYNNLTIIHHYYTANTQFPGQKATFKFSDIAIDPKYLSNPNLTFISGHLHQAFSIGNYLCTGSVRNDSPQYENQLKGVRKYKKDKQTGLNNREFFELSINYYLSFDAPSDKGETSEGEGGLSNLDIQSKRPSIEQSFQSNFNHPIKFSFLSSFDLKHTSVSIKVNQLSYDQIDSFIAPDLQSQLQNFKLKKQTTKVQDLLKQLEKTDSQQLKSGFTARTDMLRDLLHKKYSDEYQSYENLLQEMKIL